MVTALPWSPTHQISFSETPHGRLAPSSGRRVSRSSSRTSIAHYGRFAKPSPGKFPRTLHAVSPRTPGPGNAVGANCLASVRNQVRTIGTHLEREAASKFAPAVRTISSHLVRNHHCARTGAPMPNFHDKVVKPLADIQASPLSRAVVVEGFH